VDAEAALGSDDRMNDAANEHYSMLFIDEERQQGRQNKAHVIRPSLTATGYRRD